MDYEVIFYWVYGVSLAVVLIGGLFTESEMGNEAAMLPLMAVMPILNTLCVIAVLFDMVNLLRAKAKEQE